MLTNVVNNGTNFSTGQTAVGVYTYYVTETNSNGCESNISVTLTINAFNTLPINQMLIRVLDLQFLI